MKNIISIVIKNDDNELLLQNTNDICYEFPSYSIGEEKEILDGLILGFLKNYGFYITKGFLKFLGKMNITPYHSPFSEESFETLTYYYYQFLLSKEKQEKLFKKIKNGIWLPFEKIKELDKEKISTSLQWFLLYKINEIKKIE